MHCLALINIGLTVSMHNGVTKISEEQISQGGIPPSV